VIIMTSNIGSQWILEHTGADWAVVEARVTQALRQQFKPEFLNRVDDVIIFAARATTPRSAPGRSSGRFSGCCRIRWRWRCRRGSSGRGTGCGCRATERGWSSRRGRAEHGERADSPRERNPAMCALVLTVTTLRQ